MGIAGEHSNSICSEIPYFISIVFSGTLNDVAGYVSAKFDVILCVGFLDKVSKAENIEPLPSRHL